MKRGKRLILLAHCILNVNAKVYGLAQCSGVMREVIDPYLDSGTGIIQLPCPEMTWLGSKRWGMTYEQYSTPMYRKHCRNILEPVVMQIEDYLSSGFAFEGMVGIDGSPSCGVFTTCAGYTGGELDYAAQQHENLSFKTGSGVMTEVLTRMLSDRNISIPLLAICEKTGKLTPAPCEKVYI